MTARVLADPITERGWSDLLERHPSASIFHSVGWLNALRQTYGYQPFVVTTSSGAAFENGLVACRVKGWWSDRLVSLPFSDHCEPLFSNVEDLAECVRFLIERARSDSSAVEIRPKSKLEKSTDAGVLEPSASYCFHQLDLRLPEPELFGRFHHSSTRRAIRRAEREGLIYEAGTSERMLANFYPLLRMTRRRHGVPPQPLAWFRNLLANLGDRVAIHLAIKDGEPIAGLFTLSFKNTMYYKYGGSDAAKHRFGAMPFVFWKMMREARRRGCEMLDLGRSDLDQPGLIAFKDHLGAERSTLQYYRHPRQPESTRSRWIERAARGTFSHLPDVALDLAGKLIYKRLG